MPRVCVSKYVVLLHLSVLYVPCFTIRALLVSGTDNTSTPPPSAFTSQPNHVQQNPATPVVNVAASTCIAPVPLSSGHFVVRTAMAVCGCIKYSHVGKYFRLLQYYRRTAGHSHHIHSLRGCTQPWCRFDTNLGHAMSGSFSSSLWRLVSLNSF